MRSGLVVGAFLAVGLSTSGITGEAKVNKPRLDLRASPRVAFSPVNVLMTAELRGGDAADDYHCPAIEWDWDDGAKSAHESDCDPLEAGGTFERRYTAQHAFRRAGTYTVKMTMSRAQRPVAVATTVVTVRAGLGDMTNDGE